MHPIRKNWFRVQPSEYLAMLERLYRNWTPNGWTLSYDHGSRCAILTTYYEYEDSAAIEAFLKLKWTAVRTMLVFRNLLRLDWIEGMLDWLNAQEWGECGWFGDAPFEISMEPSGGDASAGSWMYVAIAIEASRRDLVVAFLAEHNRWFLEEVADEELYNEVKAALGEPVAA